MALTLDDIARQLRDWRVAAGSPSYARIAARIAEIRGGHAPARVTVYDCFREGRSRVDVDLVTGIAAALGLSGPELDTWRDACAETMRPPAEAGDVTVSYELREPASPAFGSTGPLGPLFAGLGGSG